MRKLYRLAVVVLFLQIILICIGPPRSLEDWLNLIPAELPAQPRYVVVLGGGGVPSGSTLTRCYHAAVIGRGFTNATFIVALPSDSDPVASSVGRMRDELVMRGIPAEHIQMEYRGLNTRQQAAGVRELLGDAALDAPVIVVSSQYHVRRAVLCFRKAGFTDVTGSSAEDADVDADSGAWGWLRYGVWSNAVSEIRIARELIALLVAKLS